MGIFYKVVTVYYNETKRFVKKVYNLHILLGKKGFS